jgi:hypothetical protein
MTHDPVHRWFENALLIFVAVLFCMAFGKYVIS